MISVEDYHKEHSKSRRRFQSPHHFILKIRGYDITSLILYLIWDVHDFRILFLRKFLTLEIKEVLTNGTTHEFGSATIDPHRAHDIINRISGVFFDVKHANFHLNSLLRAFTLKMKPLSIER
jgi:hypothetical protein